MFSPHQRCFILHPSSFPLPSPALLHPSSFILHPSSFPLPSPALLHPSSFILHPFLSPHQRCFILHPSSFILSSPLTSAASSFILHPSSFPLPSPALLHPSSFILSSPLTSAASSFILHPSSFPLPSPALLHPSSFILHPFLSPTVLNQDICNATNSVMPVAHPYSCSHYIQCAFNQSIVRQCAGGLVFDPNTVACVKPTEDLPCREIKPCKDLNGGYFAHPTNCRLYVICDQGKSKVMSCGEQVWDEMSKNCLPRKRGTSCDMA